MSDLETLPLKDQTEKKKFFKSLVNQLPEFPDNACLCVSLVILAHGWHVAANSHHHAHLIQMARCLFDWLIG